jgi:plasmid replication initiation protein
VTIRPDPHPIRDFFIKDLIDYSPKDSSEMMERPFFSLAKRKRNKAIHYESPDGKLWITVKGHPDYGMATIWDADILIWCISRLIAERDAGRNDPRSVIQTTPYELLKGIARGTSGADYQDLMKAIKRLRTTEVATNIRATGRRKINEFHYLGDIEGEGEAKELESPLSSLSLRVPDWLVDGIMHGAILTLDREYFLLTGGVERAIYRIARKHAGAQPSGWTCRMTVLYQKTGSEEPIRNFAVRIRKLAAKEGADGQVPRYRMTMTRTQDGSEAVHFVDRQLADIDADLKAMTAAAARAARLADEDIRANDMDSRRAGAMR